MQSGTFSRSGKPLRPGPHPELLQAPLQPWSPPRSPWAAGADNRTAAGQHLPSVPLAKGRTLDCSGACSRERSFPECDGLNVTARGKAGQQWLELLSRAPGWHCNPRRRELQRGASLLCVLGQRVHQSLHRVGSGLRPPAPTFCPGLLHSGPFATATQPTWAQKLLI